MPYYKDPWWYNPNKGYQKGHDPAPRPWWYNPNKVYRSSSGGSLSNGCQGCPGAGQAGQQQGRSGPRILAKPGHAYPQLPGGGAWVGLGFDGSRGGPFVRSGPGSEGGPFVRSPPSSPGGGGGGLNGGGQLVRMDMGGGGLGGGRGWGGGGGRGWNPWQLNGTGLPYRGGLRGSGGGLYSIFGPNGFRSPWT